MANLKMVDLGAPPASMIPVQQDVESAGQVGRAIAGLGQQAMQITQQIYQRKQNLADSATRSYSELQIQSLSSDLDIYMAKHPTDTDGLASKYKDGINSIQFKVKDYAKKLGLRSDRTSLITSDMSRDIMRMDADVRTHIGKMEVDESNGQLEALAETKYNAGLANEGDAAIDRMEIPTYKKAEAKQAYRSKGLVTRLGASIAAAQTPSEAESIQHQLLDQDKGGAYVNLPELEVNARLALADRASARQNKIEASNQANEAKELKTRQKESYGVAMRFAMEQLNNRQRESFSNAIITNDPFQVSSALSDVPESQRTPIANAIFSLNDDDRAKLVVKLKEDMQRENQVQATEYDRQQALTGKGKNTSSAINSLFSLGKISQQQRDDAINTLNSSFYTTLHSPDTESIVDAIDLKAYDTYAAHFSETPDQMKARNVTANIPFGRTTYQDFDKLRDRVIAELPSDESKYRAFQQLAFLQIVDRMDGKLTDAGALWMDKDVPKDVNSRTQNMLSRLLKMSQQTSMRPEDIGKRLSQITDESMRISDEIDDPIKRKAALDALENNVFGGIIAKVAAEAFK